MGIRYQKKPINPQILINQPNSLGNKDSEWELEIYNLFNTKSIQFDLRQSYKQNSALSAAYFVSFQTVIQVC